MGIVVFFFVGMGRGEGFWGGVFWIVDGVVGVVLLVVNGCFYEYMY